MSKEFILRVVNSVISVAISYIVYRVLYGMIIKSTEKLGKEFKMKNTVKLILGTIITLIVLMVLLNIWHISLLPYLTAFGVTGFIVGLAFQEPLSNLMSGILVLITRKLKEGDVIEIDGTIGIVEVVNYNHTILKTFDGKSVIIPNRQVWSEKVTNYWPGPVRRLSMKVSVAYNSDLTKVLEILKKCVDEEPFVEKQNVSNSIVFSGFNSSSIDFELLFWVKRENYFDALNALAQRIKKEFEMQGITIPFPQIDVHVKGR
ncbi:mechanosensitive ion channel family protein [Thermotoga profunda]|uniref:mechanosensitive ion channel family protein n=1 Tax=Thermotoga profunda TaxID=1508420 RepID=UPI000597136C|nr:mechanosensitive ion channel family protein [Thermotoga profunda]